MQVQAIIKKRVVPKLKFSLNPCFRFENHLINLAADLNYEVCRVFEMVDMVDDDWLQ